MGEYERLNLVREHSEQFTFKPETLEQGRINPGLDTSPSQVTMHTHPYTSSHLGAI